MTANGSFAVHSLDHARPSARKFAQQHVFPQISAASPIRRPRMFLSSAFHDKPPREPGPRRATFSRNRRKRAEGLDSKVRPDASISLSNSAGHVRLSLGKPLLEAAKTCGAQGTKGAAAANQPRPQKPSAIALPTLYRPAGSRRNRTPCPARPWPPCMFAKKAHVNALPPHGLTTGDTRSPSLPRPAPTRASCPTHARTERARDFALPASSIR